MGSNSLSMAAWPRFEPSLRPVALGNEDGGADDPPCGDILVGSNALAHAPCRGVRSRIASK